ncbi:MAG: hypothetical protein ACF8R9_10560 [Phycisphaerales bacterium JB054]
MIAAATALPDSAGGFDPLGFPPELRGSDRWVLWRYEVRAGKPTKVPYDPDERARIDPTDAERCLRFEDASGLAASAEYGMGFAFFAEDGYCGIDLDDCVDGQGRISPEAQRLVDDFATYAEFSPSGTGVKMFIRGRKPSWAKCRSKSLPGIGEVEIYDQKRFFTLTGRVVPGCGQLVRERDPQLHDLCARLWKQPSAKRDVVGRIGCPGFKGDDEALLQRARSATNGSKFVLLFDQGDTSAHGGDESAADMALASMLTFWCGPEYGRIERLFSASALGQRDKWRSREDYRRRTIEFAIENTTEYYRSTRTPGGAVADGSRSVARRPEVIIDTDEYRVIDEVAAAVGQDSVIFTRGGSFVEVRESGDGGHASISTLPPARLRELITRNAELLGYSKGELKPRHPTSWLVNALHARGRGAETRELRMLSETPVLRPDGTVWQEPGYDALTKVLYRPTATFPVIPEHPTHQDACGACDRLMDLVSDFPFAGLAHNSAFLAALLTVVARHAFDGPSPLFLVDANVRGAGKTMLGTIAAIIGTGSVPPVSSYVHESTECRKQITTLAMEGARIVLLDNLNGVIGNDALDRMLTSIWWRDRILGSSASYSGPMLAVWIATGNNVTVKGDTTRRTVYIRLDSPLEHPEDRGGFQHKDLIGYVRAHRPGLFADAVTIVAAYLRAGSPDMELRPFGSFAGWSSVVRSAIRWIGMKDPCDTRDQLEVAADSDKEMLSQLMAAWGEFDTTGSGVVISELVKALYPAGEGRPTSPQAATLRDAIELFTPPRGNKHPTARQIGSKLRAVRGRVIGGKKFDTDGAKTAKGQVWRLLDAAPKTSGV